MSLRDDIVADERARTAAQQRQAEEHAERRYQAVTALRAAVAPDAAPGPVAAFAVALGVDPGVLGTVLREMVMREGR